MKTRHVFEEHLYFDRLVGLLQGEETINTYLMLVKDKQEHLSTIRDAKWTFKRAILKISNTKRKSVISSDNLLTNCFLV